MICKHETRNYIAIIFTGSLSL